MTFFDNRGIINPVIKGDFFMKEIVNDTLTLDKESRDKLIKERLNMVYSFGGVVAGSLVSLGTMPLLEKGNNKYIPIAGLVTVLASTLIMTKAIKNIHKIEKREKKKSLRILAGALVLTTGISYGLYKHQDVKHEDSICPVTKVLMDTPLEKYGVNHQISSMEEEFKEDGKVVRVDYEDNNFKIFEEKSANYYVCDEYLQISQKAR